jgi:hypothetical protein
MSDDFSLQMASMDGASGFERLVNGAAHAIANARRSGMDSPVIAATPSKFDFTQWSTEWNPVSRWLPPLAVYADHCDWFPLSFFLWVM